MGTEDRREIHADATPTAVRVIGWIYLAALGVLVAVAGFFLSGGVLILLVLQNENAAGVLILLVLQAALDIVVVAGLVTGKFEGLLAWPWSWPRST